MRRLEGISLTAALAVAATLAGCDDGPATQVCADAQNRRIPDSHCAQPYYGGGGSHWVYFGGGHGAPAMGQAAAGGRSMPTEGVSYSSAPEEGISRGGFGGTGEGFGEGHGE